MKHQMRVIIRIYFLLVISIYIIVSLIPPKQPVGLDDVNVFANTYLVITPNGSLVSWGNNDKGLVGSGRLPYYHYFMRRTLLKDVISLDFVDGHAVAVDSEGVLWGWGNANEIMGKKVSNRPIELMTDVAMAATGFTHTAVIKNDGTLWTFGQNGFGQLGIGDTDMVNNQQHEPQHVMDHVIHTYVWRYTTFAISEDNTLYVWGIQDEKNMPEINSPKMVAPDIKDVTYVDSFHGYQLLSVDGKVYQYTPTADENDYIFTDVNTEPIAEEVESLILGGVIKNDGSRWLWDGTDSDAILVPFESSIEHNGYVDVKVGPLFLLTIPVSKNTISPVFRDLFYGPLIILLIGFLIERYRKKRAAR